jgi:hypothetical protein
MSRVNNYLSIQKGLNAELQKKATGKDILFLIFCLVFPFFTHDIFFNVIIFSALGMIYIYLGIINLSSNHDIVNQINH